MELNPPHVEEFSDKLENISSPLSQPLKPPLPHKNTKLSCYTLSLTFISAIGGFLFGYNTGVVSGAIIMLDNVFPMSSFNKQVFVSITMGAAMFFSLISGFSNDLMGRKKTIMLASLIFVIGGVVLAAAHHIVTLLVGRFIIGIGIGFSSMTIPMYIAECSPRSQRGLLVTLNILFLTGAQLLSYIVCGVTSAYEQNGWRFALGLGSVPALMQFVMFFFLPESPRWLAAKGRTDVARKVLMKIEGDAEVVEEEMLLISKSVSENDKLQKMGVFSTLVRVGRTRHVMRALFIGTMLQLIQQVSGINIVMYYSATIIQMSGVDDLSNAIWLSAFVASFNFFATFISIFTVDRLGRRRLTLFSLFGTLIGLLVLGTGFKLSSTNSPPVSLATNASSACSVYRTCEGCVLDTSCNYCHQPHDNNFLNSFCFPSNYASNNNNTNNNEISTTTLNQCSHFFNNTFLDLQSSNNNLNNNNEWKISTKYCATTFSWVSTFGMVLYLIFFAPGMGPMPWTINSEIYPNWARSTCVSVATCVNWLSNMVVSFTFLSLIEAISGYGVFFLYAGLVVFSLILLFLVLPETKNRSLEEIEELFKGPLIVPYNKPKAFMVEG